MARRKKRRLKKSVKITALLILVISISGVFGFNYYKSITKPKPKLEYGKVNDERANDEYGKIKASNEIDNTDVGNAFKYIIFDLGKGYSMFIDCGETEVLIDAGFKKDGKTIAKKIKPYIKGNLEYVISTNTKPNRIGGLATVLKKYRVSKVIVSEQDNSAGFKDLKKAAEKSIMQKGTDKLLNIGTNANLSIIKHSDDAATSEEKSLATVFRYGSIKISELGDLPENYAKHFSDEASESNIIIAGKNGNMEYNKIIKIITPEYYVIPTDKKITAKETKWAENYTSKIYSTHANKDIIFTMDGKSVKSNQEE